MSNIFPIDFEEKLTMAQNDYILFSDSEDGNKIKKAQYKNLKGEPGTPGTPGKDGEDGAAATITVGSTTTGTPGSSASVTNSGTSSAAVFNFTIPQGAKGEPGEDGQDGADGAAATITVGTTTTLPAGSSATVTNVGTSQDAILNFGIPKGDDGTGSGDVNGPASSTDGDVALFDGATGKLIKDSGVSLADYQEKLTAGTNIQISNNVISATGGSDIVYATQAEYNALLPGALTDGKHYFIYSTSGGGGWQPGVNTIAYFPFSEDFDDKVGSRTLTVNQCSITGGYAEVASEKSYMRLSSDIGGTNITINCWYYYGGTSPYNTLFCYINGGKHHALIPSTIEYGPVGQIGFYNELISPGGYWGNIVMTTGNWYNIVITKSGSNEKIYVNGVSAIDSNNSFDNNSYPVGVIANSGATGAANQGSIGKFSEVIFEDKVRTAQEISDYFDQTKANYGIS